MIVNKVKKIVKNLFSNETVISLNVNKKLKLKLVSVCDTSLVEINKTIKAEPYTVDWIINMPENSVFYDVGANMGIFSLIALLTGKKVVAFEPHFLNLYLLHKNLRLNAHSKQHVRVIPIALDKYASFTDVPIHSPRDEPGVANLYEYEWPLRGYISAVALDALPMYVGFFPDFVKIDVDGREVEVLEGGKFTLSYAEQIQVEKNKRIKDCETILNRMNFQLVRKFNTYKNHVDFRFSK